MSPRKAEVHHTLLLSHLSVTRLNPLQLFYTPPSTLLVFIEDDFNGLIKVDDKVSALSSQKLTRLNSPCFSCQGLRRSMDTERG